MTTVKTTIGKLPVDKGAWSASYNDGNGYSRRNRVTIFNSVVESLEDNNTTTPATESNGTITFDTTHWKVIYDGTGLAEKSNLSNVDAATVNGHSVLSDVPANAVFTDSDTHHDGSVTATSGYALTKVQVASDGTWSKDEIAIPTKSSLILDNVDNTSDATKKSNFTGSIQSGDTGFVTGGDAYAALAGKADLVDGVIPESQLPSYVDDVIELLAVSDTAPATCAKGDLYYNTSTKKIVRATATNTWGTGPTTNTDPESGKIYINLTDNKTYRWGGSSSGLVVISETLALGETSGTAYYGDRGKAAYDHSQSTHARTDATKTEASSTNGNIKINGSETTVYTHPISNAANAAAVKVGNDAQGHVVIGSALTASDVNAVSYANSTQGITDTQKSNARINIGAGTYSKPSGGIPASDLAGVDSSTGSAYKYLNEKGSFTTIASDSNKQDKITASGLLKGNGSGGVSTAEADTDYQTPLVFNTAPSSSNKVATMDDIPSSLPANGGNAATVGGHTVGTDVPSDADFTNTWRPLGTGATDACAGNDSRLSDSRNAADVYSWAKASTKPSYTLDEVTDGSTRALSNYLPLTGGTMSGAVTATAFKQTYTNPTTAASYTLSPNVAYYLNTVNQNTTFTFGSPESGVENEYKFQFDMGSTAYSITMPSCIIWQNAPTFEANKHYEISVKYDPVGQRYFGLCSSFDLT